MGQMDGVRCARRPTLARRGAPRLARVRTLVSLGPTSRLSPPETVAVHRRESTLELGRWRTRFAYVRNAVHLVRAARGHDRVALVTGGVELFALAALLPRSKTLIAADWLMPASKALDRSRLLRRVRFVVIRRSDIATLADRFGATDVRFVPFPAGEPSGPTSEGDYVYSGGWAHRDWPTLLAALEETGLPAVISTGVQLAAPANVRIVDQLTPAEGRERMRGSRVVALAFRETTLPSGPTVLQDAMVEGKAVVVTDVGGTRDYADDEREALLVPPGDVKALGQALSRLWADSSLRHRLGEAARERVAEMTAERFWDEVLR
jgi:glycosyltransferase involved in cell wall biosynthesis